MENKRLNRNYSVIAKPPELLQVTFYKSYLNSSSYFLKNQPQSGLSYIINLEIRIMNVKR